MTRDFRSPDKLIGRTVKSVRMLSNEEKARLFTSLAPDEADEEKRAKVPVVGIELDDGSVIAAAADDDGNQPGDLFVLDADWGVWSMPAPDCV